MNVVDRRGSLSTLLLRNWRSGNYSSVGNDCSDRYPLGDLSVWRTGWFFRRDGAWTRPDPRNWGNGHPGSLNWTLIGKPRAGTSGLSFVSTGCSAAVVGISKYKVKGWRNSNKKERERNIMPGRSILTDTDTDTDTGERDETWGALRLAIG